MYDIMSISPDFKIDYFLQDDICRLCWSKKWKSELFDDTKEIHYGGKLKCLLNVLKDILDIEIIPGSRPNKFCSSCIDNVKKFANFKNFCKETDRRLKIILEEDNKVNLDVVKIENAEIVLKVEPITSDTSDIFSPDDEVNIDTLSDDKLESLKTINTNLVCKKKNKQTYCTICSKKFNSQVEMTVHNAEIHNIVDGHYKCLGCKNFFKTKAASLEHEKLKCKALKDGFKCRLCDFIFPSHKLYDEHLRGHHKKIAQKMFQCKKCTDVFKTKDLLGKHSQQLHTQTQTQKKKKKYVCEHCGKVFSRHDYLYKHRMIHTGDKQHTCPYCGFRTAQRSSLTLHIRKHTGERPYQCDLCPQRCVSSSNLQAHRRRHDPNFKQFQCNICDKRFGYKSSLEEHIKVSHELQTSSFSCAECGSVYSRARGLRQHMQKKHSREKTTNEVESGSAVGQSDKDETVQEAEKFDGGSFEPNFSVM